MSVGLLEAMTSAIGEADAEIGGLYKTRLTSALQTGTALTAAYAWDGTLVVTTADTSEVVAGDWIRLDSDGQYFEIDSLIVNTSVTLLNPNSLVVPGTVPAPLSTQSSKAVTSLPVETTLDWDDSGIVALDGIVYHYVNKTATTFDDITHIAGGLSRPGVFKAHRVEASVVDLNRSRSAVDLARRATLVDYAEEEYLDAIGRNHGVLRTRFLSGDDDTFREVVKALSYNPRGTIYGIELLLDALVGADNYELSENLISYPNTVFIELKGDLLQNDIADGRTFLRGSELRPSDSSSQVTVLETPIHVTGMRLAPGNRLTNCRIAYPSADYGQPYPGASWVPVWGISGTGVSEGAQITKIGTVSSLGAVLTWDGTTTVLASSTTGIVLGSWIRLDSDGQWFEVESIIAGVSVEILNPSERTIPTGSTNSSESVGADGSVEFTTVPPTDTSLYATLPRVTSAAIEELHLLVTVPSSGITDVVLTTGLSIDDGTKFCFVTIQAVAGGFRVGIPPGGMGFAPNPYVELSRDDWADIVLRKVDTTWVELYVNNVLIDRVAYSTMAVSISTAMTFGHYSALAPTSNKLRVKQCGYKYKDLTNLWGLYSSGATLVNPDIVQITSAFVSGDVGKQLRTFESASFPINNGSWEIYQYDSANQVRVRGFLHIGKADVTAIDRIEVDPNSQLFVYPDDIGKKITLSGSSVGNDGSHTITALIEPGTLTNFDDYDTEATNNDIADKTYIAEVSSTLALESSIDWRLDPYFSAASEKARIEDAGTVAGKVLTTRFPFLPHPTVVEVDYSAVLSGQLLFDESVENGTDIYHPFYLTDLIGFLRAYLDEVTAAGVIPEYIQE